MPRAPNRSRSRSSFKCAHDGDPLGAPVTATSATTPATAITAPIRAAPAI